MLHPEKPGRKPVPFIFLCPPCGGAGEGRLRPEREREPCFTRRSRGGSRFPSFFCARPPGEGRLRRGRSGGEAPPHPGNRKEALRFTRPRAETDKPSVGSRLTSRPPLRENGGQPRKRVVRRCCIGISGLCPRGVRSAERAPEVPLRPETPGTVTGTRHRAKHRIKGCARSVPGRRSHRTTRPAAVCRTQREISSSMVP